jgi:hypothetical protein
MQTEKNEVLPENNDEAGKIGLESAISNEAGEGVATSEPAAGTAPAAGTEPEIKIDTSEIAAGIDKKKPTRARKPKTPKGEEQKPDEAPKPEAPEKKLSKKEQEKLEAEAEANKKIIAAQREGNLRVFAAQVPLLLDTLNKFLIPKALPDVNKYLTPEQREELLGISRQGIEADAEKGVEKIPSEWETIETASFELLNYLTPEEFTVSPVVSFILVIGSIYAQKAFILFSVLAQIKEIELIKLQKDNANAGQS